MIVRLKKIEISVLLLHMAAVRKNVKRGFKSNYGAAEGKEKIVLYDEVKEDLKTAFEDLTDREPEHIKELHFNINQLDMLQSFVDWYSLELDLTLEAAKNNNKEDQEQLNTLKQIKQKIEGVRLAYE